MNDRSFTIAELVPHAGTMSLLDEVGDYGDDWLRSRTTIHSQSLFATGQGVPAWVGLEYMAQTIAAYAGVQERLRGGAPKIGFLVGTRRYECSQAYFPLGVTLTVEARLELQGENGLGVFTCSLSGGGVEASANLNVFQPNDVDQFLQDL